VEGIEVTSTEFKAGQLVAYLAVLKQLDQMRKNYAPRSSEESALLVATQRISQTAMDITQ
jgi:hypothetical protein